MLGTFSAYSIYKKRMQVKHDHVGIKQRIGKHTTKKPEHFVRKNKKKILEVAEKKIFDQFSCSRSNSNTTTNKIASIRKKSNPSTPDLSKTDHKDIGITAYTYTHQNIKKKNDYLQNIHNEISYDDEW